jgi:hypothetical protein
MDLVRHLLAPYQSAESRLSRAFSTPPVIHIILIQVDIISGADLIFLIVGPDLRHNRVTREIHPLPALTRSRAMP